MTRYKLLYKMTQRFQMCLSFFLKNCPISNALFTFIKCTNVKLPNEFGNIMMAFQSILMYAMN